ncbi:MAG: SPOR domain-containing protein [Desulfovibrionaceae bacterium]
MSNPKVVVTTPRKGPKIFNITLTIADVVWMCAGLAIALTIFFVFGLLVGRGYVPSEPVAAQAPAQEAAGEAANQTEAEPAVLKPEELAYPEKLAEAPPVVVQPEPEAAAEPAGKPEAKPEAKTETAVQAKPEAAKPAAVEPVPGEVLYDYVYQVAAFRDLPAAEGLRDRLAAEGLQAEVRTVETKGVTWNRVRVLFTGSPTQTRPLRETITRITKIKPVLVGKTEAKR